jgi:hypothetical protein
MGGLLARHLATIPGMAEEVRVTITLGTPFYGAPKAVQIVASGAGAPLGLPHARVRRLAGGLPGLHDLLPVYRCVDDVDGGARRLSPSDVSDVGGDRELAEASFAWHEQVANVSPLGHVQVVGAKQPTVQALTIDAGEVNGHMYTLQPAKNANRGIKQTEKIDLGGDGTVPRESAQLPKLTAMPLAQSHGALAAAAEATLIVQDALTDCQTGPWQGAGDLGLDVPDVVAAGQSFRATISGAERPTDVACRLFNVATGLQVDAPRVQTADGRLTATLQPQAAGLYRLTLDGGGSTPVSQLVMSAPRTDD